MDRFQRLTNVILAQRSIEAYFVSSLELYSTRRFQMKRREKITLQPTRTTARASPSDNIQIEQVELKQEIKN